MNIVAAPTRVDRAWLENVQFHLMKHSGTAFALFMHRVNAVITDIHLGRGEQSAPAAVAMRPDGNIVMFFHKPSVEALSIPAAAELLKHEVLHIIHGHIATRGIALTEAYGQEITNIAMDLVINQHIDEALMAKEGWPGCTIEAFKMAPNLTTEQYCDLLEKSAIKVKVRVGKSGDGSPSIWEVFDAETNEPVPDAVRDAAIAKIVCEVKRDAERRAGKDVGRGWDSAEVNEFIEQVQRKPTIPWYTTLRYLEGKHMRTERVINKKRPSRRHPAHWGRVRHSGLRVMWVTDTSGSMSTEVLRLVEAEVKGIQQRGAEIEMVHCDAGIAKREIFNPHRGIKHFAGRGGTNFSPPLIEVHKQNFRDRPDFIVYYTDGYGGIEQYKAMVESETGKFAEFCAKCPPYTPEGIDIIWILAPGTMRAPQFRESVCQFGRVIEMPDELAPKKKGKGKDEDA